MRRARASRCPPSAFALGAASLLVLASGCPVSEQPAGQEGRLGVARFVAETDLFFSSALVVGSHSTVSVIASKDDEPLPEGAALHSGDDAVLGVGEPDQDGAWLVTAAGPGQAELELLDANGELVDAIALKAALPGATTLVDGDLLSGSSVVDARLPAQGWGFLVERDLSLLVSAVDRCGGDLLDLHASTVHPGEGAPDSLVVEESGLAGFTANAGDAGELELVLDTPGLEPLAYPVQAIDPADVDEVRVSAASADDTGNMSLWGRAFANDVEVVGPLSFSWRADPRVTLSATEGLAVTVQVSFPKDGEPPDDRPATVSAEILGEEGTLDLFTANQEVDRGPAARTQEVAATSAGCGGGGACDPFAAAGLLGALSLRRRLRSLSRAPAARRHG